ADGVAVFAMDPGGHTVQARCFGYQDASLSRTVSIGGKDTLTVSMTPLAKVTFDGTVRAQTPLEDAEVTLLYTSIHAHSNHSGHFSLPAVPVGTYRVQVSCPGYVPITFTRAIGPNSTSMTFQLTPVAFWDPLESSAGWTVGAPTDNATTNDLGQWIWVDPLGTSVSDVGPVTSIAPRAPASFVASGPPPSTFARPSAPLAHEVREAQGLYPGPVQPEDDRTPSGTHCFVTGQGTSPTDIDGHDLDGVTTLTSPTLNATGMVVPSLGYWFWFFTSTNDVGDYLDVLLSNDDGANWKLARHITGMHNDWEEDAIRVADYLAPTPPMRVRFVASGQA